MKEPVDKKPRSDSVLKTLPQARREAIAGYAENHSCEETAAWLRADGLQTSKDAVSNFLSWHKLKQQLVKNASTVETILERLHTAHPSWSPDQLEAAGQEFFTALALEQQDVKSWFLAQQLKLKRDQLSMDKQKFQRETCELFVKWSEDQRAKEIAAGAGSNTEKIAKLGELMFGETWS